MSNEKRALLRKPSFSEISLLKIGSGQMRIDDAIDSEIRIK